MKMKYLFVSAIVFSFIVTSCSKDDSEFENSEDKMVDVSITAGIEKSSEEETPESRTTINYNGGTGYNQVSFDDSETMTVLAFEGDPTGAEVRYTFSNTSAAKTTFTGKMTETDAVKGTRIAFYPENENHKIAYLDNDYITVKFYIPQNQRVAPEDVSNIPYFGLFSKDNTGPVTLYNRSAVIRIVFRGANSTNLNKITDLQIVNAVQSYYACGGFQSLTVRKTDGYPTTSASVDVSEERVNSIIVTPTAGNFEFDKAYYVAIRPNNTTKYKILANINGVGYKELCVDSENRDFTQGKIYTYEITIP